MVNKKVVYGALVVLLIVIISALAWYYKFRYQTTLVSEKDGSTVSIACGEGRAVKVIMAKYEPLSGPPVDVTDKLQVILSGSETTSYQISATSLGQLAGGTLTFRYKCTKVPTKSKFHPVPVDTCSLSGEYGVAEPWSQRELDLQGRNGTVVWEPYSTQSKVSLERGAESPEVAEPLNPITGVGKGAAVRAMGDRYRRNEALQRLSQYELQPGQQGYMEEVGDGAMSLMASVSRRSPPVVGSAAAATVSNTDIDSDFRTDGFYEDAVLKETLTSNRRPNSNPLTASKVGLGHIRLDPRFEPGPQKRVAAGETSPSHGGHAGGITLGSFASSKFMPATGWSSGYVYGFGDMGGSVEAMAAERSDW